MGAAPCRAAGPQRAALSCAADDERDRPHRAGAALPHPARRAAAVDEADRGRQLADRRRLALTPCEARRRHPDLDRPAIVEPANLRANLDVGARVMPGLAERSLLRTWTGTTCISADQLPIVGEVAAAPGLFVAAGGSLFTLGPVLARLLARTIAEGAAPEELTMFTPRRFAHLDAFAVLP
ncbi:FAD-dependent oxidoreductase [Novosphingobium resinovorum]